MLDFNNTEIAFSAKSDGELKNAYLLFNTIKYPTLVKMAKWGSNVAIKIHFPLAWAVKPTLYKQFVGGETLRDCEKAINHIFCIVILKGQVSSESRGKDVPRADIRRCCWR